MNTGNPFLVKALAIKEAKSEGEPSTIFSFLTTTDQEKMMQEIVLALAETCAMIDQGKLSQEQRELFEKNTALLQVCMSD
jgi:tartrate dehydratase beta subunit/fumarate hydratase class I family protein